MDVAVVARDRRLQLRVGARGDRLAADAQHAGRGRRAARAAERVLAGLERQRERARQARDEVLLLAQDARALEDLELAHAAGAGVGDLERRAAGVELERRGRAAGVGELELTVRARRRVAVAAPPQPASTSTSSNSTAAARMTPARAARTRTPAGQST